MPKLEDILRTKGYSDADIEAMAPMLADQRFPATIISRRLTDAGWDLSAQIIQRHRRGECKCR